MQMGQPFPGVWLPRNLSIHAGISIALGPMEFSYKREFANYRKADVSTEGHGAQMIGALGIALVAVMTAAPQAARRPEKIAEVRVHGNATLDDEAVLKLAGVAIGSPLDAGGTEAVEKRLRDSGRFDEVQVRKRYRTLAMDEVALVLVVHERPGLSATGQPPSALRRFRSRLMFFPILKYDDGYGWTYGGQTAIVDALGKGTRLSFPLSWGGTRQATSRPTARSRPAR